MDTRQPPSHATPHDHPASTRRRAASSYVQACVRSGLCLRRGPGAPVQDGRAGILRAVLGSSSLLDCLGRGRRVKATPLRGRFASRDTAAMAWGIAVIEEDGGGPGRGCQSRPTAVRRAISGPPYQQRRPSLHPHCRGGQPLPPHSAHRLSGMCPIWPSGYPRPSDPSASATD